LLDTILGVEFLDGAEWQYGRLCQNRRGSQAAQGKRTKDLVQERRLLLVRLYRNSDGYLNQQRRCQSNPLDSGGLRSACRPPFLTGLEKGLPHGLEIQ
jgi:hypothetical protein